MSKKLVIAIVITLGIIAAGAFSWFYFSPHENEIKPETIDLDTDAYLFSMGEKPMVLLKYTGTNKTMLYYSEITNQSGIYSTNSHEFCSIPARTDNALVKVIEDNVFVILNNFNNISAVIIEADKNMNVEKIRWVQNIEVYSFTSSSGKYYLFGQNMSVAKLLVSDDLVHFREIYSFKNVKFVMNSYLLNTGNGVYLAYYLGFGSRNVSWYRTALLEIKNNDVEDVYNTSGQENIFAYASSNKIYLYIFAQSTTLLVFDTGTNEITERYSMPSVYVFYHDARTGITVGMNDYFVYSRDGRHFQNIYHRGDLMIYTMSKNSALISGNYLYLIVTEGGFGEEMLKFDLSELSANS